LFFFDLRVFIKELPQQEEQETLKSKDTQFSAVSSGNEICAEEGQNPIFDPLPRNEKLCGNL